MTVLTIDPIDYHRNPTHRQLCDQVMTTHGLDPKRIVRIDLDERGAIVTQIIRTPGHGVLVFSVNDEMCGFVRIRRHYPHPGRRAA